MTIRKLSAGVLLALALAACSQSKPPSQAQQNVHNEQNAINTSVGRIHQSQQLPAFDYSQEYQTLLDAETLQAQGTHGTAIVTSFGGTMLWWCPTLGPPVPSSYQLTGKTQYAWLGHSRNHDSQFVPLDQAEPTGVYVGDSAATYVMCLDNSGKPFLQYDEANVRWTSGVVGGLPADKRVRVDEITFSFGTKDSKK